MDTHAVAGCCDPRGCDRIFGRRFASRMAKRYRRRGLDAVTRRMVDFLAQDGLQGASVLEIGGGVGEVGIELLRRGASSVTNVELTSAYDVEAGRLASEFGVSDRTSRRIADIAATSGVVDAADVVVLNRVVCCYPDYARLLGAAADLCRCRLAFTHPPRNIGSRAVVGTQNALFALARKEFRTFAHPPQAMIEVVDAHQLRPVFHRDGSVWQIEGFVR